MHRWRDQSLEKSDQAAGGQNAVLVVDDDQVLRSLLSTLLTVLGYKVVEAGDGVEALAVLEQNSVTAILMDVMMPNMDGFEACRRVKDDPLTAHIPVVLVTALADNEHRQQGVEAGADEYVYKPIDVEDLLAVLGRVLPDGRHD
jgi:two-component system cell cycle response regulator